MELHNRMQNLPQFRWDKQKINLKGVLFVTIDKAQIVSDSASGTPVDLQTPPQNIKQRNRSETCNPNGGRLVNPLNHFARALHHDHDATGLTDGAARGLLCIAC